MIASARIVGGSPSSPSSTAVLSAGRRQGVAVGQPVREPSGLVGRVIETGSNAARVRSEEHTSELQSLMRISYAVFCLKKKTNNTHTVTRLHHNRSYTNQNEIQTSNAIDKTR